MAYRVKGTLPEVTFYTSHATTWLPTKNQTSTGENLKFPRHHMASGIKSNTYLYENLQFPRHHMASRIKGKTL